MREHEWQKDEKIPGLSVCTRCGFVQRMYYGDAEHEKTPRDYYFLGSARVEYIDSCNEVAMRRVLG